MDSYTRVCGVRAVTVAGSGKLKRRLADALLTDLGKWSNRELGAGIAALYPEYHALEELLRVLGDKTHQKNTRSIPSIKLWRKLSPVTHQSRSSNCCLLDW